MKRNALGLCVLVVAVCAPSAWAQWTTVGDGIEYQLFSISGPNKVFVTRMNRSNTNAYLESTIGQGRTSGGTETIPNQYSRYNDAIGYWTQTWGTRNNVIVAINGSYYNTTTGAPYGGITHSGWYAQRHDELGGWSGFVWDLNRNATMGLCVSHPTDRQYVTYANNNTQQFRGINIARPDNQLIIYTPQYDTNTLTDNTGSEVLIEMSPEPFLIKPQPNSVRGTVKQIRQNLGSTQMPFDHIVLSAKGNAATTMLNNVQVGDTVKVSQEVRHYMSDCQTSRSGIDWTKAYAGVGGNWVFLRDGVIIYGIDSSGARHPRTGIGLNSSYVFYMVVDGRQAGYSIGMTIDEMAEFFKNTLAATWACNQDGGGSSTMVVNGTVKNSPSDGSPRSVANGMLMCNIVAKAQSTAFSAGQTVKTTSSANVRLGPGTNYAVITTVSGNTQGTIADHNLRGVSAKGYYWWKVSFSDVTGWVAETLLVSLGTAPAITEHPASRAVLPAGTATFTVQATGTAPLNYQWQKNTANIYDGGSFSGTQTSTLTVTGVTSSETGAYRCVVTNSFGNATSNEATLTISSPDFDEDEDVDQTDFAHLQLCLGTTDLLAVPQCADTDLNGDGVIDYLDSLDFQQCASGPEVPMDPACGANP